MQIVAPETLVVVENGGNQRIIYPGNKSTAFMCRWLRLRWLADEDLVRINKRLDEAQGIF